MRHSTPCWPASRRWCGSSELGGAVGQREISELVEDDELGAGVAADDAGEFAAAFGFLEFVGEAGERGEANAASGVAGADRQGGGQMGLAGAAVADEDHGLAVVDPRALGQRGDRGLGDLGVVGEAEVLEALDGGEARVDQAAFLAALGALGHLGFQQRGEISGRGLLLARGLLGERAEAAPDGRQLELDRVRLDERLERRGLRVLRGRGHRAPPSNWS